MHRRATGNFLLFVSIIVLIYIVATDKFEQKYKFTEYKPDKYIDTVLKIDTATVNSIQKLKAVDSIIQSDRKKEQQLLLEAKHIKDSISIAHKQIVELKRILEHDKRALKEKYEKHIEKIYETNCIQRGGPEDTLSNY
jgi:hypothetical protein